MYKLVIVESPAKAKTIEGYLGSKYKVVSSVGHVRDLAKTGPGGLGIDVENNFEPSYTYIRGKKKVVNDIKKLAKDADEILIATDPDREGEAIGWHLADELFLDLNEQNRITFSEITKDGILEGIRNVHKLDMDLVHSQETRRKIDRLIGFKLSKLLQKKIKAKSAGRVQSVALQMIVYREREIRDFVPVKYYKMNALYNENISFEWEKNKDKLNYETVNEVFDKISNVKSLKVIEKKTKNSQQKAKPAYTTSTFQQDSINKLGYSARRTMSIAQKLYEGIDLGNETRGLITYMRTDSTRLEAKFVKNTMGYISGNFGKEYVGFYKENKKSNSQDAHEAIRPTDVNLSPDKVKNFLDKEQLKVYTLIWNRTVASLMSNSKSESQIYKLDANDYAVFKYVSTKTLFDGFKKVYYEDKEEVELLDLEINQVVDINKIQMTDHETQPKPRYTEAKLIKALEENGVGRPSTYAAIIDTLKKRNYVELIEKKFHPTEDGELVTKNLDEFFSELINAEYTSKMESDLDLVAQNELDSLEVLKPFYDTLVELLEKANEEMETIEAEKTGNICPECGSDLVMRKGRYGEFEACSNFPKCRYITKDEANTLGKCPKCEEGSVVIKKTRRGKEFYGCDRYPKCDYAKWDKEEVLKEINGEEITN